MIKELIIILLIFLMLKKIICLAKKKSINVLINSHINENMTDQENENINNKVSENINDQENENINDQENDLDIITTTEWDDPHKICLNNNEETCLNNNDCLWIHDFGINGRCVKKPNILSRNNINDACNSYNFKELDNNPDLKNQYCKNLGCNNIYSSDTNNSKKICVHPFYENHEEYCRDAHDINDCENNIDCSWNKTLGICTPKYKNSNDICKKVNQDNFIKNKRCLNSNFKINNDYCHVDTERDLYENIIPYTGIKNFKKSQCINMGCKFFDTLNNNDGICVNPDFSEEEEVCFKYHNKKIFGNNNVAYKSNKCNSIGCKYVDTLEPIDSTGNKRKGICVHDNFFKNDKVNIYKVCDYANIKYNNNKEYCLNLGCKFNKKCYY